MAQYSKTDLVNYLYNVADRYGIDRDIAYAQIQAESSFNPNAKSGAGAQGIAQFMPTTAAAVGLSNPFDPYASLEAYGYLMNQLLSQFNWRYDLALAAYNSGPSPGRSTEYASALAQNRAIDWSALPARTQAETPHYVDSILGAAGYSERDAVAMNIGGGDGTTAAANSGNGGGNGGAGGSGFDMGTLAIVGLAVVALVVIAK